MSDTLSATDLLGLVYDSVMHDERGLDLVDALLALELEELPSEAIVPHLQRAEEIRRRLEPESSAARSLMDELPLAVFVVDQYANIQEMNALARKELEKQCSLLIRNNTLMLADEKKCTALHTALQKLTRSKDKTQEISISVYCPEEAMPIQLFVRYNSALAHWMKGATTEPVLSVSFLPTESSLGMSQHMLVEQYQLTQTEARISLAFALLPDIEQLALRMHRSAHTIRSQLKVVYQKTGCHNQADLVRLILTAKRSPEAAPKGTFAAKEPRHNSSRDCQLRLPDGSIMGYADYGDEHGIPVFFFHCFISNRLECSFDLAAASELNIRLIAPERSGYGLSSLCVRDGFSDWPARVTYLADSLGIDTFYIAAYSGSTAYALACGCQLAERIRGIALISPMGEINCEADLEGMMPFNRRAFELAMYCPSKLTLFFGRMLAKLFTHSPEQYFVRTLPNMPPVDQKLLTDPCIRQHIISTFEAAHSKHHIAISLELARYTTAWDLPLEAIGLPMDVWHGELNRHIPFAMTKRLVARLKTCNTHYLPKDGYYLLYSHWRDILDTLTAQDDGRK